MSPSSLQDNLSEAGTIAGSGSPSTVLSQQESPLAGISSKGFTNMGDSQRSSQTVTTTEATYPKSNEIITVIDEAEHKTGRKDLISKKGNVSYMVKSFIAGGIAGCAAKTVIAPLDRVKILFQTYNPHYMKYSGKTLMI
jgi:hypothetical protein